MSESNLDSIHRELMLRKVRREGAGLLKGSGRELYDFLTIKEKHDKERERTETLYRDEYKMRVDVAYQVLLKKAASKTPELKPSFFGIDRFNTSKLQVRAQHVVRFDHDQAMMRLDERELKETRSFLETCSQRGRYLDSFKNSAQPQGKADRRRHAVRRNTQTMSD